jgi:hypothetical protein
MKGLTRNQHEQWLEREIERLIEEFEEDHKIEVTKITIAHNDDDTVYIWLGTEEKK